MVAPRFLFVALSNDVCADRIVLEMRALGCVVGVVSEPNTYAALACPKSTFYALPKHRGMWIGAIFFKCKLLKAITRFRPDRVIPLDDIAASFIASIASSKTTKISIREIIDNSIGSPEGYAQINDRFLTMRAAQSAGVRTPKFQMSRRIPKENLSDIEYNGKVLLKQNSTCGGHGVQIFPNTSALDRFLRQRKGLKDYFALSRGALRRSTWRMGGHGHIADNGAIIQQFVGGRLAFRVVAADKGKILSGVSFLSEKVISETGSSCIVRHIEHEEMRLQAELIIQRLQLSGFIAFDYILKHESSVAQSLFLEEARAYLIEVNPRPIGVTYLGKYFGHDLCRALAASIGSISAPITKEIETRSVAIFPKLLEQDPNSRAFDEDSPFLRDLPTTSREVMHSYVHMLIRRHPHHRHAISRVSRVARPSNRQPSDDAKSA